jgi:tetratricopeptide (TPR) repeat protein
MAALLGITGVVGSLLGIVVATLQIISTEDFSKGNKVQQFPSGSNLPAAPGLMGREKEFVELRTKVKSGTMTALVGIAGVGKTHIAKKFARDWLEEADVKKRRFAFWLESETEAEIRESYVEVMKLLDLEPTGDDGSPLSVSELRERIWDQLESLPSQEVEWMVVFNNAPEAANGIEGPDVLKPWFFPVPLENWSNGRILFTTRSDGFRGETCLGDVKWVPVGPLPEQLAIKMLLKDVVRADSDDAVLVQESIEAAKELVTTHFDGLPLAIDLARKLIIDKKTMTVRQYLDSLRLGEEKTVEDKVFKSLKASLKHVRQDDDLGRVLSIAAYISPDQIPVELFGTDKNAIRRLCNLNLLQLVRTGIYSMHRLIQEASRKDISPSIAIEAVAGILSDVDSNDSGTWKIGVRMIPHVNALVDLVHKRGGFRFLGNDKDRLEYAGILFKLTILDRDLGENEQARSKYKEALEIFRHVYGADTKHVNVAHVLMNLGQVDYAIGKKEEGRSKCKEALGMFRHVCGADTKNVNVAIALKNLAILDRDLGENEQARSELEEAMEIFRHVYGVDTKHVNVATVLMSLGVVDYAIGKKEEGRSKCREALGMFRHVYGADTKHVNVARLLENLTILDRDLGDKEEARLKYQEALEIYRHIYGTDSKHVNVARVLNNLGEIDSDLGKNEQARSKYEEALEIYRHEYGADTKHVKVAIVLGNLGHVDRDLGENEQARSKYKEVLEIFLHEYGADTKHVNVAYVIESLGDIDRDLGEKEEARSKYKEALEIYRQCYGADIKHVDMARLLNNLAILW